MVEDTSLTGQSESHLCSAAEADRLGARVRRGVVEPFLRLHAGADAAGFDLRIVSGFRGFERQRSIWNRKTTGELAVLDDEAEPMDIGRLSSRELVYAILRWSALPGASRHHWGTDIDVYDERARPDGYEIDLIPEEVERGGMFAPLHEWLDERIDAGEAEGFFRPYDRDRQGVAPERWHLSHAPAADPCEQGLSVDALRTAVVGAGVKLEETVLEHLDDIYERFVININQTRP